jgi:hypothetical protein
METVKVKPWGKDQGDFVTIDKDAFVEGQHELYVEGESGDDGGMTVKEIKAKLDELKVEYPSSANKAELLALLPKE